jgi:hypothetical protein
MQVIAGDSKGAKCKQGPKLEVESHSIAISDARLLKNKKVLQL